MTIENMQEPKFYEECDKPIYYHTKMVKLADGARLVNEVEISANGEVTAGVTYIQERKP